MKIEEMEILTISSDDDDDLPLKVKTYDESDDDYLPLKVESYSRAVDNGASQNLYDESWEKCEFCDLVFHNKYNILVHTAKHIIIPLIKQELYQCSECLFHFKSTQELRVHAFRNHSETTRVSTNNLSLIKCESSIQNNHTEACGHEVTSKIDNLLESFVKREPLVKCDDLGFSSLNTSNAGFKNRLQFEDELDEVNLLTDLTTDCKVNIEMFDAPWFDHAKKLNVSVEPGLSSQVYKSVHYNELMLIGRFVCKSCKETFPNRYELVIHETQHMYMRGRKRSYLPPLCPVCERYISGNYRNLRQHIEKKHTDTPIRKHTTHHCKKCGLKYINYGRHIINYHQIYKCKRCGKGFEDELERTKHAQECTNLDWDCREQGMWESRIINICDLCYSFTKSKQNCQYVNLGDFSELGKRQTCEHCSNTFFELKMVKAWYLQRVQKVERRKGPSCQDRLMKRLKMLKKKYYICCFIYFTS